MPPLFNLQRYLKEISELEDDDATFFIANEVGVASGMREYLEEVYNTGDALVRKTIPAEEMVHLLSMVAGVSFGKLLSSDLLSEEDKRFLGYFATEHSSLLRYAVISIMFTVVGLSISEEWR